MYKAFFIVIFLFLNFNTLFASLLYTKTIEEVIPFNLNLNSSSCEKVSMLLPVFKKLDKSKYIVYGNKNNFLISCDKNDNQIFNINFYKNIYFKHLLLNKNIKFKEILRIMSKHFRKHLLKTTYSSEYSILEVFVSKNIYEVIIYNNNKENIEFISLINMEKFPEYKYLEKIKNKSNIPPLIFWLIN